MVLAINLPSVSCKVFYCMICTEGLHFSAFHYNVSCYKKQKNDEQGCSTANLSGSAIKVQSSYVTCKARACVFDDSVQAAVGPC